MADAADLKSAILRMYGFDSHLDYQYIKMNMENLNFKKEKNELITTFYLILDDILSKVDNIQDDKDVADVYDFVYEKMKEIDNMHESY